LGYSLQSLDGDDDSHHAISGCHDYAVVLARFQQALILEKVQMPPLLGARVMRRAQLTALRAPKFLALSKSNFKTSRLGSPSNRHSTTFHLASSCRAAVNNASGVIAPILFPLDRDLQGPAMRPLFLVCRALLARLIKIKSSPSTNSQQRGAMFTLRD